MRFTYTGDEEIGAARLRPAVPAAREGGHRRPHRAPARARIARLIARFYEFQGGQLLIDGQDIRALRPARSTAGRSGSCRRSRSCSPARCARTSATAAPRPATTEVCAAAQHISNGEWLDDLPDGLDTDVGERGANLSMGQRQLVALARVVLKDPAILILDEATASVDPFTETQIQEGLETVMSERTAIVIAHRLSTVTHADRIIVMRAGPHHRRGLAPGAAGAGRPLRRAVQHLLPPPGARLPPAGDETCGGGRGSGLAKQGCRWKRRRRRRRSHRSRGRWC